MTKFGIAYEHGRESSKDMVHKAIDQSFQNLKTDYFDLYLVH